MKCPELIKLLGLIEFRDMELKHSILDELVIFLNESLPVN